MARCCHQLLVVMCNIRTVVCTAGSLEYEKMYLYAPT
jgi:hypothetical protein